MEVQLYIVFVLYSLFISGYIFSHILIHFWYGKIESIYDEKLL